MQRVACIWERTLLRIKTSSTLHCRRLRRATEVEMRTRRTSKRAHVCLFVCERDSKQQKERNTAVVPLTCLSLLYLTSTSLPNACPRCDCLPLDSGVRAYTFAAALAFSCRRLWFGSFLVFSGRKLFYFCRTKEVGDVCVYVCAVCFFRGYNRVF